jgi:ADP-heptose:LPS heptosyltransferase
MLKKLLRKIKRFCRSVLSVNELLLWQYCLRRKVRDHGDKVVVIQDCHVGDFLVSLPFFQRLRDFYGRKLTLVSDKRIVPLAMSSGCFDEVVAVDMKQASSFLHIFCRWKTLWRLRKITAKVLLQKYSVGGTSLEDCMAAVIPATEKIGVESEKTVSNGGCKFYGRLLKKNFDKLYKYDTKLNLLENENAFCNMVCSTNEQECVGDLECFEPLPERDVQLGEYALFIVGADDPRRRLESWKFAEVAIKYLEKNPENKVLFSGTPAEQPIIAEVLEKIPEDLKKRTKVREAEKDYLSSIKRLFADVKHAELVLVGETGPLHIAAKYKTKCLRLSGGWHYNVWAPWKEYTNTTYFQAECPCSSYGCFGVCKYKTTPFKCLQELSAIEVSINMK